MQTKYVSISRLHKLLRQAPCNSHSNAIAPGSDSWESSYEVYTVVCAETSLLFGARIIWFPITLSRRIDRASQVLRMSCPSPCLMLSIYPIYRCIWSANLCIITRECRPPGNRLYNVTSSQRCTYRPQLNSRGPHFQTDANVTVRTLLSLTSTW